MLKAQLKFCCGLLILYGVVLAGCKPEVFEITMKATGNTLDEMAFDPTGFTVKEGAVLKVKLLNKSEAPGMFHNVVFCTYGKETEVGFKGIKAGEPAHYIPQSRHVVAGSELIAPGDSTTFQFAVPKPGKYGYVCTFPGHYTKMAGVLNVIE